MSLERRRPLSRILDALARQHLSDSNVGLSTAALQEAAWPSEKLVRDAGAHRVRVAISTLRKLGLGAILVTREDGYLLSPDCPIFLERSDG